MKIYKYGRMKLANMARLALMRRPKLKSLYWECTLRCNAKCKHCFSNADGGNQPAELTTFEIKDQLRKIAQRYRVNDIAFSVLGGEPLLRKDIFDVMGYAHALGYSWGMATNGTLIDSKAIQLMKETGMTTIAISLDGVRETHDNFRGVSGCYDKALESTRMLADAGFLDQIQITTVFSKENLNQMQEIYETIKSSGANLWQIVSVEPVGRASQNKDLLLDISDYKILFDFIKKIRKERKLRVAYGHSHFLEIDYEFDVRDNCFTCQTGIAVAGILHNGDVFACPSVPRLPHLIQGNIRERDFCDIWENEFKLFRDENRTSCLKCKECEDWQFCYGGSFHTWNHEENKQNVCLKEGYE